MDGKLFNPEIRGKINKIMRLNIKLLAKVDEVEQSRDLTDEEEELIVEFQNLKEAYVTAFGTLPPEPDPVPKKKPVVRKKPSKKERKKMEAMNSQSDKPVIPKSNRRYGFTE